MDYHILSVNERWYPTWTGMDRQPVTVVLVGGEIGDYAAYVGIGSRADAQGIAAHGDKLTFAEACCHFPGGQLDEARYRL